MSPPQKPYVPAPNLRTTHVTIATISTVVEGSVDGNGIGANFSVGGAERIAPR